METRQEFTRERTLGAVYCESVGEYALPDYNGDVKKILMTDARAIPSGVFSGGDTLDCAGIVSYKMVYLDAENNITHLEFSTDYDFSVRCDMDTYVDSSVATRVSNFSLRLLGPRKIVARATLESDVNIIEREAIEIMGDATDGAECASENISLRSSTLYSGAEREYAELLCNIEGALADEVEVLYTDAVASELTLTEGEGGAVLGGKIRVSALVRNADALPITYTREIEIEETVDSEYEVAPATTQATLSVTSLTASVTGEEDGVSVVASLICEYKLYTPSVTELSLTTDSYLTDSAVDNGYTDFAYTALMETRRINELFEARVERDSCGCENARSIPCCTASMRGVDAHIEGDRLKITGEIRFSGVACEENEDGEPIYTSLKLELPFEKYVNLNCHYPEGARAECTAQVTGADVELDGGCLYPRATLSFYISVLEDRRTRRLASSVKTGEPYAPERNRVHVVFPEASDTLFDIAKRYHTTLAHLAAVNSLTEDCVSQSSSSASLKGVNRLIIK